MLNILVNLGDRAYEIEIRSGSLHQVGGETARMTRDGDASGLGRKAFVLTHPAIHRSWGDPVVQSLSQSGFEVVEAVIPAGERQKSPARLTDLLRRMLDGGLDRNSVLVALGGGVVGDLGGLAAALYMRGIPYVQIPTTLLAMVDSSVGGKTAIDLDDAKNAVGVFHQPSAVFIDPEVLATLPKREIRAGLAEVVKYGVLGDATFFEWIHRNAAALLALEPDVIAHAVKRSIEMKARLVEADEFDRTGARAVLNLGHTVGHALEALGGYRLYRHGEAVAVGLVAAARIAEKMGVAEAPLSETIATTLQALGLPVRPKCGPGVRTDGRSGNPFVDPEALLAAMRKDKKTLGGELNFILPVRIGATVPRKVQDDLVLETVREMETEEGG